MLLTLDALSKPGDVFNWRYAYLASTKWKLPKAKTGEWDTVGTRQIADIAEVQERNDTGQCEGEGVRKWRATAEGVENRNPEVIVRSRHYDCPKDWPEEQGLDFLVDLGVALIHKFAGVLKAMGL